MINYTNRKDDVEELYKCSKTLNTTVNILFFLSIALSILSFLFADSLKDSLSLTTAQVIIAISFILLSIFDDFYCWYNAESIRRKSSIENAFNIDITNLYTEKYYNNKIEPSINKYNINTFENILFSKSIAERMSIFEIVKGFICIVSFIICCLNIKNNEAILVITQALFSAQFIIGTISLLTYIRRLKDLYNAFYFEFVTAGIQNKSQIYALLALSIEYEAVKAHYKIRISSKLFRKMNTNLSRQWNEIYNKIKISDNIK